MQTECSTAFCCLITIRLGYLALFVTCVFALVIAARCCKRFAGQKAYEKPQSEPSSSNFSQQKRPIKLPASFIWRPF